MKILLVQPGAETQEHAFRMPAFPEPLALEVLAAHLPDHDVRILDLRIDNTLDAALGEFAPDIVGVTALTTEVYDAYLALDRARELLPDAVIVVGGIHASLMPRDFDRPSVDAIVKGEGELTLKELVSAVEDARPLSSVPGMRVRMPDGGYVDTPERTERVQLDDAPLARRDLLASYRNHYHFHFHRPTFSIEAGRGCPFKCDFCSVWKMHPGKCRYASAERVFAELESIEATNTLFVDDHFLANVPRARTLCEMIRASGMQKTYGMQARSDTIAQHPDLIESWAKIGLGGVLIGFETPCPERLKKLNKSNSLRNNNETIRICKANGVDMWGAFIVNPDFEPEDFQRLLDYVSDRGIVLRQFTVLTPLPGTPLFEREAERLVTRDYRLFDCLHSVLPTKLPREEFYRQFTRLYRRSYGLLALLRSIFDRRVTMSDIRYLLPLVSRLCNYRAYLKSEEMQLASAPAAATATSPAR